MQCTSYALGCYYLRDLNVGLSGCSGPTANSDIRWNSGHGFNILLPPPTMDHDLDPQKEICRQMMLKHESTFKYQVYELHRLYRRQKELMEETRKRELLEHSLKLPSVSERMSEISMETHWPSRNLTCIESSMLSKQMFQEPSSFTAGDNERLATDRRATKDEFEGCQYSSSQRNKSRKRMLDLELPGDLYIDSEEENEVQVPKTPVTKLQPVHESKLDSFHPEGSSVSDLSCRKTNILFDLNEPAQPDESDFPSSSSLLESDSSQHDATNQNQDLPEKEKSNADFFLPNKETLPEIAIREGHRDACQISSLLEKDGENGLLPCNFQAGGGRSNLNSSAESSCCLMLGNPHKRRKTSDSKMPERNHDEANIDVPSFVSSRRKSVHDSKEFRIVVQALPCINDTSLNKCYKSSISKPRLSGKKFNLNKIRPTSSHLTHDADSVNTTGPNATAKCFEVSDCVNLSEVVDLNLVPPNYLSDDEFSLRTSIVSHLNPPEPEDKETESSGKYRAVDSSLDLIPTKQQIYGRDDHVGNAGLDGKLSTCISLTQRDLKAPVSPENRECSPPRADSQETQLDRSIGLLKEGGDQEEANDRLAADTLILILSSGVQKYSKTIIQRPEVSIGCLNWFAGIASTLANDQGKDVGMLLNGNSDQNDLWSGVHDCIKAMKMKVANSKVKYCACKVNVEIVKETVDAALPCGLKTEVTGHKQMKSELEFKDRTCSGRRKARSGNGKGLRSSKALKMTACSHLKQQTDCKKLRSAERCLKLWGNKKKRMARWARSTPLSLIFGISSQGRANFSSV